MTHINPTAATATVTTTTTTTGSTTSTIPTATPVVTATTMSGSGSGPGSALYDERNVLDGDSSIPSIPVNSQARTDKIRTDNQENTAQQTEKSEKSISDFPFDFFTSLSLSACTKLLTVLTECILQSLKGKSATQHYTTLHYTRT